MERIEFESLRFACSAFADKLIGREALERFQLSAEIVGVDVGHTPSKLAMAVGMIMFDGDFIARAAHSLDQTTLAEVIDLSKAMFDAVLSTLHIEHMGDVAAVRPLAYRGARLN
jgi:hypothetical protein